MQPAGIQPPDAPPLDPKRDAAIVDLIAGTAELFDDVDGPAFGALFDRFGDCRVVLLGEASHGTAEFYRARAAITRRLLERHGFNIVAVEADWPDAAVIDRRVRGKPSAESSEAAFQRFPTWMWRNTEFQSFTRWLADWNAAQPGPDRVSFHGLDLYNLSGSITAVLDYLDETDAEAAAVARERYGCLQPWVRDPQTYGRMAATQGYAECEGAVVRMLSDLLQRRLPAGQDRDDWLDATANARLVRNAEAYYRIMYYGAAESWNLRDTHMFETLCAVLDARGPNSKAVVWAHNSHIGDASRTEMGLVRGELNIGQLCREGFGSQAALIGFGTHTGTVACASDWGAPMETKAINPSRPDSYERLCHDAQALQFVLDLRADANATLHRSLRQPRLERFIGVIYRPETERWSHYSACSLSEQFDGWVWFDETTALVPTAVGQRDGAPDTFPFGL